MDAAGARDKEGDEPEAWARMESSMHWITCQKDNLTAAPAQEASAPVTNQAQLQEASAATTQDATEVEGDGLGGLGGDDSNTAGCASWCAKDARPWADKCNFESKCAGCCDTCEAWCADDTRPWTTKCKYIAKCKQCCAR
jgi:hypothetical protein